MYLAILAVALFAVASFPTAAKNPATEQEPVYNPATTIDFFATVTEVREVPVGSTHRATYRGEGERQYL